ncbi:glycylpeptide N-tetradecanoyltransferase 2 [Neopelma chrysocephalum]|nr:glycylpeptide N-tetradecanoyltransferase 2 [Neopelma chrysocephalum]
MPLCPSLVPGGSSRAARRTSTVISTPRSPPDRRPVRASPVSARPADTPPRRHPLSTRRWYLQIHTLWRAECVFYRGISRGKRCCLVVVPSPLILLLKSSHAVDQAVSPVAWGADRRGIRHRCGPWHPTAVGLPASGRSPGGDLGAKKKKKKQKRKKEKPNSGGTKSDSASDSQEIKIQQPSKNPAIPMQKLQDIQRAMELLSACQGPAKNIDEATKRKYQFWDTQPVPKLNEVITSHGAIEPDKDNVRLEPYSLPQGFMWDTLDLSNAEVLKELYTLLNENYVEDDDNMFRFDYSPEFLLWALRPPGWLPQWHCGVRVSSNKKLVGFISAIPASIRIYDSVKKMVEINFLCVHKKLRSKRVAPVLIREITRRVNLEGIFQAVYTAGVVLPKPVATCRYWHRSLNPRKLVEVKFSHLSRNMTLQRTMKLYRLPDATKTSGLRPMEQKDTKAVQELINTYLKQFNLAPVMDEEEVAHWFLPRDHIIDTYVVEGSNGILTDFLSFYTLPSTVMHHPVHKSLKAAYSFYNIHTETPLLDLMNDALIIAKLKGFDVFNALDLMENKTFLEKLKFGIGDGNLQYYLYNWRCPGMESEKVGLVLQ